MIKEKEETKKRCVTYSHNVVDNAIQRPIDKQYRTYFNQTWSTIVIEKHAIDFTKTSKMVSKPIPQGTKASTLEFQ
jgi:uncharacterized membrane protein